jgi:hypothetical protein
MRSNLRHPAPAVRLAAMPALAAICDNCGTVFPSGFAVEGTGSGMFTGNKSGPCPDCGSMGSVPDGLYQFADNALTVFSTWPVERLQALAGGLQAAQAAANPQAAVQKVLSDEPALSDLARTLGALRDPQTFIAFVTMLLTAIMLITSQPGTTINAQTVIESPPAIQHSARTPATPSAQQPPAGEPRASIKDRHPRAAPATQTNRAAQPDAAWSRKKPRNNAHRRRRYR